jgi:hypothetical protein
MKMTLHLSKLLFHAGFSATRVAMSRFCRVNRKQVRLRLRQLSAVISGRK